MAYRKSRKKEESIVEELPAEFEGVEETEELSSELVFEEDPVPFVEETLAPTPAPIKPVIPTQPERPGPLPKCRQPRNTLKFTRG